MRLQCSECEGITDVVVAILQQRRKAGLIYACVHCSADLIVTGSSPKRGRSDNQKRSKKQEEGVAKRTGAKRQKASGSLSGAKGDVRKAGTMRGECKFTRARSFSLKLDELMKIEREASAGEQPVMFVEFQGVGTPKRFAVIPEWLYETYAATAGDQ